jgi:transcriptional antiterminator Rof (Rho-off)
VYKDQERNTAMAYENKSDERAKQVGYARAKATALQLLKALQQAACVVDVGYDPDPEIQNEQDYSGLITCKISGVDVRVHYCTEHKRYDSWHYVYTGEGDVSWYAVASYRKVSRKQNEPNVKLAVANILRVVEEQRVKAYQDLVADTAKESSLACMIRIQESLGLKDGSVLRTTPVQDHVEVHLESLLVNEAQATAVLQVLLDQGLLDRYRR